MDNMINLTIDGVQVSVPAGTTVLEAARKANIKIPTLCYLKNLNAIGACRMCVVETGARAPQAACVLPVAEGMNVKTNTPQLRKYRRTLLELLLSIHDRKCLSCPRNNNCELQDLCRDLGVEDETAFAGSVNKYAIDDASPCVVRNNNKCVLCRRCVAACHQQQNVGVIGAVGRGFKTQIASPWDFELAQTGCVGCGQCIVACPVGALQEKDGIKAVDDLLASDKHVYVQTAPAVRAALGEEFGLPMGTPVTGKMVAALRRLGFEKVFDTDYAADLTILEEGTELVHRIQNQGVLPMITSCSPGWIKYCEHFYPEMIPHLSTCKSPQQMFGAMYKTYYARKRGLDPADIVFVSAIPCTAKKFEVRRPGQSAAGDGIYDVDYAITTRELARMIEKAGINYRELDDEKFDEPFDIGSGAGAIFGATGGVMEAALRTAAEVILGTKLEKLDFDDVRGTAPIKTATYKLGDTEVRVAVASGTKNARELLNKVKAGELEVDFIEIMACPGGCVNGGGQPVQSAAVKAAVDLKAKRASILYNADKNLPLRKSHENLAVQKIYDEYLEKPGSHLAHEILHTHYTKRGL